MMHVILVGEAWIHFVVVFRIHSFTKCVIIV
jgi:hypothetical protein